MVGWNDYDCVSQNWRLLSSDRLQISLKPLYKDTVLGMVQLHHPDHWPISPGVAETSFRFGKVVESAGQLHLELFRFTDLSRHPISEAERGREGDREGERGYFTTISGSSYRARLKYCAEVHLTGGRAAPRLKRSFTFWKKGFNLGSKLSAITAMALQQLEPWCRGWFRTWWRHGVNWLYWTLIGSWERGYISQKIGSKV